MLCWGGMKVVLFDRDGTLIVDPPDLRVDKIDKIQLFPDTIEALKLLANAGFSIIMITNQAGIAENLLTTAEFVTLNDKVKELLAPSGIQILNTYMCPHDDKDGCDCRKPKPKLLLDAISEFGLTANECFMVGDRQTDILAGMAAGTKTILVETANTLVSSAEATFTAAHLLDAVQIILANG